MTRQIKMGVVADDITGANDIGIMFAKAGLEVHVYSIDERGEFPFDPRGAHPDICILDTNSRLDAPQVAYQKVFNAVRMLQSAGCRQFHNKTCSVFRGNIGSEFDGMLDALQCEFAVVVLGFPKTGRTTVNGKHYVRGVPLAHSEFRHDPVHPMTESDLTLILQAQTKRRVAHLSCAEVAAGPVVLRKEIQSMSTRCNYLILDVADQEALQVIAHAAHDLPVLCGSSALAEELPAAWGIRGVFARHAPRPASSAAGVVCAAGSLMPQTRVQIEHVREAGVSCYELPTLGLFDQAARQRAVEALSDRMSAEVQAERDALLYASNDPETVDATRRRGAQQGLDESAVARLVSESLAETVGEVVERTGADRLVIAGGETSAAVTRRLGIRGLAIEREIQPGLPSCSTLTAPLRRLVLKSGSFGSGDFLEAAIRHLKED